MIKFLRDRGCSSVYTMAPASWRDSASDEPESSNDVLLKYIKVLTL